MIPVPRLVVIVIMIRGVRVVLLKVGGLFDGQGIIVIGQGIVVWVWGFIIDLEYPIV